MYALRLGFRLRHAQGKPDDQPVVFLHEGKECRTVAVLCLPDKLNTVQRVLLQT